MERIMVGYHLKCKMERDWGWRGGREENVLPKRMSAKDVYIYIEKDRFCLVYTLSHVHHVFNVMLEGFSCPRAKCEFTGQSSRSSLDELDIQQSTTWYLQITT